MKIIERLEGGWAGVRRAQRGETRVDSQGEEKARRPSRRRNLLIHSSRASSPSSRRARTEAGARRALQHAFVGCATVPLDDRRVADPYSLSDSASFKPKTCMKISIDPAWKDCLCCMSRRIVAAGSSAGVGNGYGILKLLQLPHEFPALQLCECALAAALSRMVASKAVWSCGRPLAFAKACIEASFLSRSR